LVDTRFRASIGGQLDVIVNPPQRSLRGSLYEKLTYDLSLGSGAAKVIVYFPRLTICGPWYLPHPCFEGITSKDWTLFGWNGWALPTQTLFNKTQTLFEIALPDCTTCASAGAQCGAIPSNCGGTIDCGTCGAGYGCSGN